MEDAALLCPDSGAPLAFTVDFITPIVDDPYAFGAIAIAIGAAVVWFFLPKKQKELELVASYEKADADKA